MCTHSSMYYIAETDCCYHISTDGQKRTFDSCMTYCSILPSAYLADIESSTEWILAIKGIWYSLRHFDVPRGLWPTDIMFQGCPLSVHPSRFYGYHFVLDISHRSIKLNLDMVGVFSWNDADVGLTFNFDLDLKWPFPKVTNADFFQYYAIYGNTSYWAYRI